MRQQYMIIPLLVKVCYFYRTITVFKKSKHATDTYFYISVLDVKAY